MPLAGNLHTAETVFLFLLVLVALFAALAHRLKIPYPIVLVLAGLGISFVPSVPQIPLDPNLIFLVFLPPLLYASAWNTNLREFRKNIVTIAMLALGLVAFTVWGVAEVADRFILALDWKSGFLLGAVVATTDAIAAASIAKSIGLPQGIVDILEGESLVNDATGLLALEFGLGLLLRNETPTVAGGAIRLFWLLGGGVIVGLVLGVVIEWLERWVDDGPVEMVVSV
ncbi:MAG TPA: cation:proton antiporter, partial [Granulicella sp.]